MSDDLNALAQNIADISGEATDAIAKVAALVVALMVFGEKAYPYIVKVIDASIDMFSKLGEGYEYFVALLSKLKTLVETKLAENGYVTKGDIDEFFASIETMHALQLEAEKE